MVVFGSGMFSIATIADIILVSDAGYVIVSLFFSHIALPVCRSMSRAFRLEMFSVISLIFPVFIALPSKYSPSAGLTSSVISELSSLPISSGF